MGEKKGPLSGLHVIEMAAIGPCPLAGQFMADLGAQVISIDRASAPADKTDISRRAKRSIALDLKADEGMKIAGKLIAKADILIEGFRPGVMERLGLGPNECMEDNPRLIYGRITGWGQDGPLAKTAGHDLNYLALSGALHAMGRAGEPPMPPLNYIADNGGGTMFLLFGVLSALYERSQSGLGQIVDASMVEGIAAMSSLYHRFLARGEWDDARESNLLDGGAPFYRVYETKDGRYLAAAPLEGHFFAEFLRKAGLPGEHLEDQNDKAQWPERRAQYAKIFKTKTRDEWVEIFEGSDACLAPVLGWEEAADHPHNRARGSFTQIGGVLQARPAPRFSRSMAPSPCAPGGMGADSHDILGELGYSEAEIDEFSKAGVLR